MNLVAMMYMDVFVVGKHFYTVKFPSECFCSAIKEYSTPVKHFISNSVK